jgi:DNA-binding GntR family transcriptional regulator
MDADPIVIRATSAPRQVADFVRQAIDRGDWDAGTPLPAERLLAERYRVSIAVIRQALAMLVAEGLIIKSQGKPAVVRARRGPTITLTRDNADPWAELTPTGTPEHLRESARPRIAALLGIPDGSPLYVTHQNATHTSGRPVLTTRIVTNHAIQGQHSRIAYGPRRDLIKHLAEHHGPLITTERNRPLMPDADERDHLKLGPGDLLLEITRITHAHDGQGLLAETERHGEDTETQYRLS